MKPHTTIETRLPACVARSSPGAPGALFSKSIYLTFFLILFTMAAQSEATNEDSIGSISFPTSATGDAQEHFLRGVGILHSFGWKQARQEFQAAQKIDPGFAMAYWGESLCYNHPLIPEWDRKTPQQVLNKLGGSLEQRLAMAPTAREKGFIHAVDQLFFGDDNTMARRTAYMLAMRDMHAEYPKDDEIAAIYALSLLMSADRGSSGHQARVKAGAIAMQLLARNPDHPGAAHYTIHAFDDPVHAPLALPAALVFADIAAAVSHARHMPAHIFIQHGMWDRVSASNQSAYDAAVALYEPGDSVGDMVHALDWGQYGDLQRGDYARAEQWITRMESIVDKAAGQARAVATLPLVRSRYILETRAWKTTHIDENSTAPELLAAGISATQLEDLKTARRAEKLLAFALEKALSDKQDSYYRNNKALKIMHDEVAGLIAIEEGQINAGLTLLSEAVETAESMRAPNGAPNPIKPPHELYGEALASANRPEDALKMFEKSLLRTPNRTWSLLGAARANVALGNPSQASKHYSRLVELWRGDDLPGLNEAKNYIAARDAPGTP